MSRRGASNTAAGLQLFPYLAVLICTVGALVVLLLATARNGQAQALAANVVARADDNTDEIKTEVEGLQWRISQLQQSRTKTEAQLGERRLQLGHIEDHLRRLREQLQRMQIEAEELERIASPQAQARAAATAGELSRLQQMVAMARQKAEEAKQSGTGSPSYAVVPYQGPNETRRRPIYIECRGDVILLQPEGIKLNETDFDGPMGSGNPLAAALRAQREYLKATGATEGDAEPYPLLLVRPDGIPSYYAARAALASWGSDFGYELIGEDWKIEFPPGDPTLREATKAAIAAARERQKDLARSAPRSYRSGKTSFRASPTRGGFVADGSAGGSGSGGGGSNLRWGGRGNGGFGGTESGGAGNGIGGGSDSPGGGGGGLGAGGGSSDEINLLARGGGQSSGGGLLGNGGSASGGGTGSDAGGMIGQPGGGPGMNGTAGGMSGGMNSAAGGMSGTAGGMKGPAGGQPGGGAYGSSQGSSGSSGAGSGSGSSGSGGSSARTAQAGQAGQPGQSGNGMSGTQSSQSQQSGMPAPGFGEYRPSQRDDSPSSSSDPNDPASQATVQKQKKPDSMAKTRGRDWGLPDASHGSVGVTRPVYLQCQSDKILIMPEDRGAPAKEVRLSGRTQDGMEELVSAVWTHMKGWGIAGKNLYWKPTLVIDVAPGAEHRFNEVQALLSDSGMDVTRRTQSPAATATRGAVPSR